LHSSDINPCAEPAGGGGIAEAMEVPLGGIEFRPGRDLLAALVKKAVVEAAFRGRKDQGAVRHMRVTT